MIETWEEYLFGAVTFQIIGYSPERFINLCSKNRISVRRLIWKPDGYEFTIMRKDIKEVLRLVRKAGIRMRVKRRIGVPFFIRRNHRRAPFFAGIAIAFILLFIYSQLIWDIEFEGNLYYTNEAIEKFIIDNGYQAGMFKSTIHCETLEKLLRNNYNKMTWVSARIDGSKLIIQVKENEVPENEEAEELPGDLVSDYDGEIVSMITKSGIPMVHIGDTVEKGQMLVEGRIAINNDAGEEVNSYLVLAKADITARVVLDYEDTISRLFATKHYTGRESSEVSFQTGSGNSVTLSVPFAEEYELYDTITDIYTAPSLYYLQGPLSFLKTTIREYEVNERFYTEEECSELTAAALDKYIKQLEESGIIIENRDLYHEMTADSYTLKGTITVLMPIGITGNVELLP